MEPVKQQLIAALVFVLYAHNASATRRNRWSSTDEAVCGEDVTPSNGRITLPTTQATGKYNGSQYYQPNLNCSWIITAEAGGFVTIMSTYFTLEGGRCRFDYVEIEDISEGGTGVEPTRFCGRSALKYVSTSRQVRISFHSDRSYEFSGFSLNFSKTSVVDESKCNTTIRPTHGGNAVFFQDSDFHNNFLRCLYRIKANSGDVVQLTIRTLRNATVRVQPVVLDLEIEGDPMYRILERQLYRYTKPTEDIIYNADDVIVDVRAYSTDVDFLLQYVFEKATRVHPLPTPDNDCSSVHIINDTFVLESPNFPRSYPNDVNCTTIVRTPGEHTLLQVQFPSFWLEPSEDCIFDSLEIFSGEREASRSIVRLCGRIDHRGRVFRSSGNSLRFVFLSDRSYSTRGFRAEISAVTEGKAFECPADSAVLTEANEIRCFQRVRNESICSCENGGVCVLREFEYECECPNAFGGDKCQTKIMNKTTALTFTDPPLDAKVRRGDRVTKICAVGDPRASYLWLKNGQVITDYHEGSDIGVLGGGVLFIKSFSEAHISTYSCIASSPTALEAEWTFTLSLDDTCSITINPAPEDIEKRLGDAVFIKCETNREFQVTWYKDGNLINVDSSRGQLQQIWNALYIERLEENDHGEYICKVKAPDGCEKTTEPITLSVTEYKIHKVCGLVGEASGRIVSGQRARNHSSPWHVSFLDERSKTWPYPFCGGTLISDRWVLTAAHCEHHFTDHTLVLLGTNRCTNEDPFAIVNGIHQVEIPDGYLPKPLYHKDIALVHLNEPVDFSDYVKPICLKRFMHPVESLDTGLAVGCGYTSSSYYSRQPEWLMEVNLNIQNRESCAGGVKKKKETQLTDTMFCAGFIQANRGDTCQGDSGGSLSTKVESRVVQVGITSWGYKCDTAETFGYYTNVLKFDDWIHEKTELSLFL